MKRKAISLFSGGLDSILAAKIILDQGIEVMGVVFESPFFSSQKAIDAAKENSLPLMVVDISEEHLEILKAPKYGYGKNFNPCIDCHALMLKKAGKIMQDTECDFIITGEVLGQRPMSQNKQALHIVSKNSGYHTYILRPLSAKLLPKSKPEIEGMVDREKLFSIHGRGRKIQEFLAQHYGIKNYSPPAGGCLLTDPLFTRKLRDLFSHQTEINVRDVELLKLGRLFRINNTVKVIIGRNRSDNSAIIRASEDKDVIINIMNFPGPTAIIPGGCDDSSLYHAASICALYSDSPKDTEVIASIRTGKAVRNILTRAARREDIKNQMI